MKKEAIDEIKEYHERFKCSHWPRLKNGCWACGNAQGIQMMIEYFEEQED